MESKICCVFNLAPHYRAPIYKLMDTELKCDFYFGNTTNNTIKLIDYNSLTGFKGELKNIDLKKNGFIWQKGVFKLIFKPYKYYIITGSPALLSSWLLLLLAKIMNKKVYAWTHGIKKPTRSKGDKFQKLFYKLCYRILLYGDYSKNNMILEGFKEDKLKPIYNSLDYSKQLQIRSKLSPTGIYTNYFKNSNPVLIYIGRIQNSKKLDLLVLALNEIIKNGTDCNLVFVGGKTDSDNNVNKLVSQLNLTQNVWFYGPCYDENIIGELLYNADVCVSPGPIGLTALHALSFGCPAISNDDFQNQMPEFEVIKEGLTGAFFKNDDLQSLTNTIGDWINLPKTQRDFIRNNAYRIIDDQWNPHYQIKVLKELLS